MPDPFLTELYDRLHDTPMQRKFKRIRPMPAGVVFMQWPGMGWDEMREHLRLMKRLGYNCLKGIGLLPGFDTRKFQHMAMDEGIIPWWYGEAGWDAITDELLDKLGIPRDASIEQIRADERLIRHQDQFLRQRIDRPPTAVRVGAQDADPDSAVWEFNAGQELRSRTARIEPKAVPMFVDWLKRKYGTLGKLREEWNCGHVGICHWSNVQAWEEAAARVLSGPMDHDYNRHKDVIRFKTEVFLNQVSRRLDEALRHDPQEPLRAGGEMSVFLPLTGRGIDMEGFGRVMADRGSLYPSTHLAWHFDKVNYEIARTVYMYSSIVHDMFKGGWSATWESTGGPQQISGDKGASPYAKENLPAYTVDAGVMTQLMVSYLAAGYKGFGFWCWTHRTAGREGGEYALLDRNGHPGSRAVRVGQIAAAASRLRDELWEARKEPLVGVLFDPENDIQWSVMTDYGREIYVDMPVQARVGVSRALINANVPWEYVSADDLRKGLAQRYRIIYLPAMLAVSADVLAILGDYVRQGGRLVMDMPGNYFDEKARVTATGRGSAFEALFGASIDDYQYSSNVPRSLGSQRLRGFVVDMTPTTARVLERYDLGQPAVIENVAGRGTAVILGYEASLMCARPGNSAIEAMVVRQTLGTCLSPYACADAIVYRLAAPKADHYFFVNDGPAQRAVLDTGGFRYASASDPVSGEELKLGAPIDLEPYSGRWVRFLKA